MLPFPEFAGRLLTLYEEPLRAPKTRQRMRQVLGLLGALPGVATAADLTTDTMARYVACRAVRVCPTTIVGEIGYLRAICSFAVAEGLLERSPQWRRVTPRRSPPVGPRALDPTAIRTLLAYLASRSLEWKGHRLFALATLVAHTGLRRNEALYARVEDLDLDERLLWVSPRRRLKTLGSAAPVPLCPDLAGVLRRWVPRTAGGWLFPGARLRGPWVGGMPGCRALDRLQQAARAAGVGHVTWQSLRHTLATHARKRLGLSREQVRDILRHTTVDTQSHYVHDDCRTLVDSVADLSFFR